MNKFFSAVFVLIFWSLISPIQAQAQEPVYNIENVTGDLYRFQSDDYFGVFLVTDEGILLVDPINTATSTWLKGELDARFDKKVKVIFYSHHHADHISGAEVFLDTVEVIIAHEEAKPLIEAGGYTVPPSHTFSQGTYVELGEQRVEAYSAFSPHTNNSITIYFTGQKAVYIADLFFVEEIFPEEIEQNRTRATENFLREMEKRLDFQIAIPSHGKWGSTEDLQNYRNFLGVLNKEIVDRMRAGKSLAEIKSEIQLPQFQHWANYENGLPASIEAIFNNYYEGDYFPLVKANPRYPRKAQEENICGSALVEYDILEDGTTENATVIESDPPKIFDRPTKKAAEKYIYFTRSKKITGVRTRVYYSLQGGCHWEFPTN